MVNSSRNGQEADCEERRLPKGQMNAWDGALLKKGDMSVYEYTERFVRMLVSLENDWITEEGKIHLYANGLPSEYANKVKQTTTFYDARVAALFYGGIMEERIANGISPKEAEKLEKSKILLEISPSSNKGIQPRVNNPCSKCGKGHIGRCLYGTLRCFSCGEEGHKVANCETTLRKSIRCRICLKEGHIGMMCPEKGTNLMEHCNLEMILGMKDTLPNKVGHANYYSSGPPSSHSSGMGRFTTTAEATELTARVEDVLPKKASEKQTVSVKRKFDDSPNSNKNNRYPSSHSKKDGTRGCKKCGKRHVGECKVGTADCFKCGQFGHKARDCRSGNVECFSCHEKGHYSSHCPRKGKEVLKND